jgi:hypothetical protein
MAYEKRLILDITPLEHAQLGDFARSSPARCIAPSRELATEGGSWAVLVRKNDTLIRIYDTSPSTSDHAARAVPEERTIRYIYRIS